MSRAVEESKRLRKQTAEIRKNHQRVKKDHEEKVKKYGHLRPKKNKELEEKCTSK